MFRCVDSFFVNRPNLLWKRIKKSEDEPEFSIQYKYIDHISSLARATHTGRFYNV